jgi:hypothetical protein
VTLEEPDWNAYMNDPSFKIDGAIPDRFDADAAGSEANSGPRSVECNCDKPYAVYVVPGPEALGSRRRCHVCHGKVGRLT